MSTQRIITRENPAVWYHKGEIVTDTQFGIVGRPWCSTTPMTIFHDADEYAALIANSKPYTATTNKKRNP